AHQVRHFTIRRRDIQMPGCGQGTQSVARCPPPAPARGPEADGRLVQSRACAPALNMETAISRANSPLAEAWASPAARYYFAHKAVAAVAVPFTAALVIARLSPAEQGFFFAILSLVSFQALGEFGFNAALAHFASHEASRLSWSDGVAQGPRQ